jgi:hypothetical protein
MKNSPGCRSEERDFRNWLHRTVRKLKRGELPPETWEVRHPLNDSAVQRRIARMIGDVAAKGEHGGRH